ncbi:MAG: hypothetical protein CL424_12070 [Acidimicrobiaceae bacterium]|nr:hypothetical protein [Acidimicrobiaceae bacterium]
MVSSIDVLERVFFCVGAAKTGTTILARLLDQQPTVACMSEAYFPVPRSKPSIFNPANFVGARHGFRPEQIEEWHRRATKRVAVNGVEVDAITQPSYARDLILEVLSGFGENLNARFVGEKWPYYSSYIELMLEAFPDAIFVYNVRDPRAVWNSGQTFRDRRAGDKILNDMIEADHRIRAVLDNRFVTFRYEDLIVDPGETMQRIAAKVGFRFEREALKYDESTDRLSDRWNWVPTAKGDLNRELTEKWRDEMTIDQQRQVRDRCSEFLQHYGYPLD